jgi:hypothetical protein
MFKQGSFYAIQGKTKMGSTVFLESVIASDNHQERLRAIAKRAARFSSSYEEDVISPLIPIKSSANPFEVKVWDSNVDIKIIISMMRMIRKNASDADVDPNSLKIVVVETSVEAYIPESPSDEETELRRYVLEKLSDEEKKLLNVTHWEVYGKLADRSMLDDEES